VVSLYWTPWVCEEAVWHLVGIKNTSL